MIKNIFLGHITTTLFFLMTNFYCQAQKINTKSLALLTENDSYMLMGKDGYYTNGLSFSYSWTNSDPGKKTINSVEFGQLMYNAKNGSYREQWKIDRPITAYLYGRYVQTRFFHQNVLQWKLGLGTIGPNALGRQMQEFIHRSLGMYKPQEWKFQLDNALAIDANILYVPQIFAEQQTVNFYPILNSSVGMTYNNVSSGFYLTIGSKESNDKSSLWNAHLNQTNSEFRESFFYIKPILTYSMYNATIQGGIFSKDANAGQLNRIVFNPKMGWQYAHQKVKLNIGISYSSREAKEQRSSQWYGSIDFGISL